MLLAQVGRSTLLALARVWNRLPNGAFHVKLRYVPCTSWEFCNSRETPTMRCNLTAFLPQQLQLLHNQH